MAVFCSDVHRGSFPWDVSQTIHLLCHYFRRLQNEEYMFIRAVVLACNYTYQNCIRDFIKSKKIHSQTDTLMLLLQ